MRPRKASANRAGEAIEMQAGAPNGIVFVDKPEGFTSHDVVAKLRRRLGTRKIGHAGTLDPMATGLLTLGVGPSTRLLTYMVGLDKTYAATIRLGMATVSDDREGEVLAVAPHGAVAALTDDEISRAVARLTGDIEQAPSSVSAIKVQGKRAYDLVREGQGVELKKRPVKIYEFVVLGQSHGVRDGQDFLDLEVRVTCSSGTYVRALARDLGANLGVGGHLVKLRRTAVGPFMLRDHEGGSHGSGVHGAPTFNDAALTVQTIDVQTPVEQINGVQESSMVTPPGEVAARLFETIELDAVQAVELLQGKRFMVDHADADLVAAMGESGSLLGLVAIKGGKIRSLTNFPQEGNTEIGKAQVDDVAGGMK